MSRRSSNLFCCPTPIIAGPGSGNPADNPSGPVTYESITPNNAAVGSEWNATLAGTGFADSGINAVIFDTGTGHAFNGQIVIDSDIQISITPNAPSFQLAGVYEVYTSTDNGVTRSDTGLTFTIE